MNSATFGLALTFTLVIVFTLTSTTEAKALSASNNVASADLLNFDLVGQGPLLSRDKRFIGPVVKDISQGVGALFGGVGRLVGGAVKLALAGLKSSSSGSGGGGGLSSILSLFSG